MMFLSLHTLQVLYHAEKVFLQIHVLQNNMGGVRLVTAFRYHGKLYSYSNDKGPFACIIGSNNLSSIIDGGVRVYENSVLLQEQNATKD